MIAKNSPQIDTKDESRVRPAEISGGMLARNTFLNFIGQSLPLFLGVITIPLVVRGLGNEQFGILSLVWVVIGYFSLFDLGLGRATTKFVSELLGKRDIKGFPSIVWTSLFFNILLGTLGGVALAIVTPILTGRIFNIPYNLHREAQTTFFILAPAVPIIVCTSTLKGILEGGQRFDLVNLIKIPSNSLIFLIPAIGIPFRLSLHTIVFFLLISRLGTAFAYLILCFKTFPALKRFIFINKKAIQSLFIFGGWITVSNIVGPIFNYLERFLIASFLSVSALTFYSAPYEVISRVIIFPASIAMTLFPAFSYYGRGSHKLLTELFSRPLKYLLFIMTLISGILFAFAGQILNLWLGNEFYQKSTLLFQILTFTFFLHAFAYVPYTSIQGLGRPDLKAKLDLINVFIFIGFSSWLIPQFGINGAALAKLIISIIDVSVLFFLAKKVTGSSTSELFPKKLGKGLIISGIFIAVIFSLKAIPKALFFDALLMIVCIFLYTSMFLKIAMDNKDWSALRDFKTNLFNYKALR